LRKHREKRGQKEREGRNKNGLKRKKVVKSEMRRKHILERKG